jgi:hypothetical protein
MRPRIATLCAASREIASLLLAARNGGVWVPLLWRVALCVIVSLFAASGECSEVERFQIFPGESYSYEGVAVSWIFPSTQEANSPSEGYLTFKGPHSTLEKVSLPEYRTSSYGGASQAMLEVVYIDGVFAFLDAMPVKGKEGPVIVSLQAGKQAQLIEVDAAPHEMDLFVSAVTSAQVNNWKFQVIPGKAGSNEGPSYPVLTGTNLPTGQEVNMTARVESERRFGRFTIKVAEFTESSSTVYARLKANPDLTIQGGDSYLSEPLGVAQGETLSHILGRLAELYGFDVEWVECPGHPELIEEMKSLRADRESDFGRGIVSERVLNMFIQTGWQAIPSSRSFNKLTATWPDSKHLRVENEDCEEILARKEKQEREEAEIKKTREEWQRDYKLAVRIYTLERLTPVTAKAFIDSLLHAYVHSRGHIAEWAPTHDVGSDNAANSLVERCIPDDKSSSLIVTAIPATHKKIEELLAKMEAMASEEKEKGPVKQYRLEIVLLKGEEGAASEKAPEPDRAASGIPPATTASGLDTVVGEISIQNRSLMELADILSNLGNTDINVAMNLDRFVSLNVKGKKTIRQLLEDLADLYLLRIDYQPRQTIIRDGQVPVQETASLAQYGISPADLKIMGVSSAVEIGRAVALLADQTGEEGRSLVSLTPAYACELEYLDMREPYLVAKGRLVENSGGEAAGKTLLQTTLYLEPDKPTLLGLTNLREALILLVRRYGD